MRKIKTVVLCVILSAMLCGCANNKEGSAEVTDVGSVEIIAQESTPQPTPEPTPKPTPEPTPEPHECVFEHYECTVCGAIEPWEQDIVYFDGKAFWDKGVFYAQKELNIYQCPRKI